MVTFTELAKLEREDWPAMTLVQAADDVPNLATLMDMGTFADFNEVQMDMVRHMCPPQH